MSDDELLQTLGEHHRIILSGLGEIRFYCAASYPKIANLDAARSRLSRASLARSKFVSEKMVPRLLENADADLRDDLSKLLSVFQAKRQISASHVAIWTPVTIAQDWEGYRAAARLIWTMMEKQIDHERSDLGDRLIA
ncbi:MAG: hypothetical protein EOO77_15480 [Oxalobacteraceae bacterium]|nr:MAG: hypothetical protein EOO77_15480 [Oxalobacteraceae bacterium]